MEPGYNELPRDWQNLFAITRFRYIEVLSHILYFTEVKTIFRYMEVPQYFSTRVKGQWRIYTFREWAEGGGGEGGGSHPDHPDPEIRGGGGLKFFSALRTSVWSKNNRGERGPPGFSPGSATEGYCLTQFTYTTAFRKDPLKCSITTLI